MTELIEKLDPQLDNPGFASTWFEQNGKTYPATPAFEWVVTSTPSRPQQVLDSQC